jgi:hypothetical protein
MDFNSTIDLIRRELDEAYEIIDDLKKSSGAQLIQIELAKSKCRNAAMAIELLKTNNPVQELPVQTETKKSPDPVKEPVEKPWKASTKEVIPGKQGIEPVVPIPAASEQKDIEETDPDLIIMSEEDNKPEENKPYVAPIIADSFSHLANTFNEHVGKETDDYSYIKKKQVTSLASAIGVNDRFYYIREVFNGDRDAYSRAISELENITNIEDAKGVIAGYRKQKAENDASRQLLELVKRKLSPDE